MSTRFATHQWRTHRRAVRAVTSLFVLGALLLPAVPSVSAATTCERTFTGDATGARDVTASLTAFLDKHGGKRLCLKSYGKYRVDGTVRVRNEYGLRLDGRNATLRPRINLSSSAQRQQLRIESSRNVIIRNLSIRGLNPDHRRWNAGRQHEHGIAIYGGDLIKLQNVVIRDTYGDGVYVGYVSGRIEPSSRITLGRLNIARAGRNGVAIVGGHYLVVTDSVIAYTGLHAVDLEPDLTDADIHHVTIQRTSLGSYGQAGIYTGYAIAVDGWAGEMSDIRILDNSAYRFNATVLNNHGGTNRNIVFTGNRSSTWGRAYLENIQGLTFSGNVNIKAVKDNVN